MILVIMLFYWPLEWTHPLHSGDGVVLFYMAVLTWTEEEPGHLTSVERFAHAMLAQHILKLLSVLIWASYMQTFNCCLLYMYLAVVGKTTESVQENRTRAPGREC